MDKYIGIESFFLTPDARHITTQNRPFMGGGHALLGIVDALCPSVGQRDKEGSIRKQKRREGGGMELCRGPSVSIKTHTVPKNPWKQTSPTKGCSW